MGNLTAENAWGVVQEGCGCEDHRQEIPFKESDIDTVFEYDYNEGDCAEHSASTLFRLKDGRYVTASVWCDTSGHGCQCGGSLELFDSKAELLKLGVDEARREAVEKLLS